LYSEINMKGQTKKQQPVSKRNQVFTVQVKDREGKMHESKISYPIKVYGRQD